MKKLVLFLIVSFAMSAHAIAATIYVNDGTFAPGDWCTAAGNNTTGNGTSSAPFATLNFALSIANTSDVVRVDQGTYNNENNVTVIDANLTIEGYSIASTVFQRTSGTLNFLVIAANGVIVRNLTVQNYNSTSAALGKAITANNVSGVLIYNCAFTGNSSGGGEPALYTSNTGSANTSLTVRKCSFRNNIGNYGGAISVTANTINTAASLTATIDSCYFENNVKGSYYGGAIVIEKGVASAPSAQAPNVTISNSTIGNLCAGGGNRAQRGGALYTDDNSNVTINNSCFSNNTAEDVAGPDGGGAIWSGECTLTLNDCKFENNNANVTVAKYGGAIYANGGFNLNTLTINRCAFIGNTSNRGGGIYIDHCTALIKNALFYGNIGTGFGGGIAANDANANVTIYNSTFSNNTTSGSGRGGAIDGNQFQSPMHIKNCIVYGNGTQKEIAGGTNIQVRWSDIGTNSIAGTDYNSVTGNTTANPLFTNSATNDYTLSSTLSPAYNTGNTDAGNAPTNDINSINRTTLEMGCYAFGSAPVLRWSCANPTNLASISGNTTAICPGGTVTLTAAPSSGYTYSWTSAPSGFTSTAQTIVVSPTVTTVYQVNINNGSCGVYGSASYTVTVNPVPSTPAITANGPVTFCSGDSVTLTSSAATSYLWSTGATSQSITVNTSGNYSVTVSNASGCTAGSAATTVTVNANPSTPVVTASGPVTFCTGGSVTLSSSSAVNNLWNTGATTQNIVVSNSGTYSVTVSNASGCTSASASTTVTVNPNPSVPVISANGPVTFCAGDSVVLSSSSSTNNVWSTGDTTQTITVTNSGNYFVTVTNTFGCSAQSASTTVNVNANPSTPAITAGGPVTFCVGDSVVLSSSSAFNNLWNTGDTTQSIVVTNGGAYSVTVTNVSGCSAGSAAVIVTVNALPQVTVITASGPLTFCAGDSVVLTSSSATNNNWNTGDTTQSITVTTSGSYYVTVFNGNGCQAQSATDSVHVNSLPSTPTLTLNGPATFCAGDSVILTSSASVNNLWNTGDTTQSVTVFTSGTFNVIVSDSNGCIAASASTTVTVNALPLTPVISTNGPTVFCAGDSVVLTSNTVFGNQWNTGDTTQSITVYTSGTFSLYVVNGNNCVSGIATDSVTVNALPPAPTVTAQGPATFCLGDSVTLSSSSTVNNIWSNGAQTQTTTVYTSGTYTVMVTDTNGCSSTSSGVTVTANPLPGLPTITVSGPTTICQGGSVTLSSSYSNGNVWSTGSTNDSIVVTTSGTYSVINTNTFGCSSAPASITITINPAPQVDITSLVIDTAFCGLMTGSINGIVITAGTAPYSYAWYDASGNATGNGNSSINNLSAGSYYLIVTDNNGCADTTGNLVVPGTNGVQVVLTATPTSGYAPLNVEFTATASQLVSQYAWDMGATSYSTTSDTTGFLYTAAGNYTVTVTVTDNNGCTDSATVTIVVDEEITLEIPNVFTPNGDGTNDLFLINTTGIDQMTVSIYDRWGVLIAVVEGVNAGWDGRAVNGLSAVDGTYYFVLDYVTYRGEAMNKSGFVTLLH